MFIRQTRTNNKLTGEGYFTYRLVRGERIGGKVRQITILNLGRHFPVKQDDWPVLCRCIETLLHPQDSLLGLECPARLEQIAQRIVAQLIARAPVGDTALADGLPSSVASIPSAPPATDYQEVDLDSLQQTQPRSVGVEHLGLHALWQLGLIQTFTDLGINGAQRAAIIGNVIGRMAAPVSNQAYCRPPKGVKLTTFRDRTRPSADVDRQRKVLFYERQVSDHEAAFRYLQSRLRR